ncbi:unnamed protein product, partial [Closterium sp. NIES-54]
ALPLARAQGLAPEALAVLERAASAAAAAASSPSSLPAGPSPGSYRPSGAAAAAKTMALQVIEMYRNMPTSRPTQNAPRPHPYFGFPGI